MPEKRPDKDEIIGAVCRAVLDLEYSRGHLRWTLSEVSRLAKVSRPLVYYYFGKNKESLLEEAFHQVAEFIFDLITPERREEVDDRMMHLLTVLHTKPHLFALYFFEKNKDSKVGATLRAAEKKHLERLRRRYPKLESAEVFELYLLQLGAIAYQLPPQQTSKVFSKYRAYRQIDS